MTAKKKNLEGKIALVAGATRGAGRGIACMLGEAGAVVYCTGRSSRNSLRMQSAGELSTVRAPESPFALAGRPETIEETAEMVSAHGGEGVAVRVDHRDISQVKSLFEKIKTERGRIDILVNDIWAGDELAEWGLPFWEQDPVKGFRMIMQVLESHILTAQVAAKMMVARKSGLIIEITDGDSERYRGNLFYDLVKSAGIRLAAGMAEELRPYNAAAVALTPGFLRSEAVLEYLGVTENNWQDGAAKDPHFIASETPYFVGRAAAALAGDPDIMQKSGSALSSWDLSEEYGFTDVDGRSPHWGRYFAEQFGRKELT